MESSKPDGKKIILKKRLRDDISPERGADPARTVASTESVDAAAPESKYFYEGEIFDQFYRPLKVHGGIERLREMAMIPLTPVAPPPRESARQREAAAAQRQAIAEALAHQIFTLAQRERETQIDMYLSAFNVALAERTCQEAHDILHRANEFFTEHYYALIRERGERPEMYAQIIKRVGHAHAERFQRIVFGLDVQETAKKLWDLHHGAHSDKGTRILDIILDHTESQVLALREEFLRLPYKDLAQRLYRALNRSIDDTAVTTRRTIGKSELSEHKRLTAFHAREQLRTLRYLLMGRGATELVLVKRFYIELGDQTLPDAELEIEAHIRRLFPAAEVERLSQYLKGWTALGEAEEIHKLIVGQSTRGVLDDLYGDPRDSVDREYTQGLGPFLRRFKKSRLIRWSSSVNARSFLAFEPLRQRVSALSYSQFMATNEALGEHYRFELDPTIFPSLNLFDARQRAVLLRERLSVSFDIFEALQPIEFLEPRESLAVQRAFQCLFGVTVKDALERRLLEVGVNMTPQDFSDVISRYVDGKGRWPLNIDLLSHYHGLDSTAGPWSPDFIVRPEDEARAIRVAALVDQDASPTEIDRAVREEFFGLPIDVLHGVERAFYDLTEPRTPLREALVDVMTPDGYSALMLTFSGLDSAVLLQRLHTDPMYASLLRDLPCEEIHYIRESFKRTFFKDLVDHVVQAAEECSDKDLALEAISALLKPEIFSVRKVLGTMRREGIVEVEALRTVCSGSPLKVMGFERGYDLLFSSLRLHLKLATARMALSVGSFVELIFLLEGIDTDILNRIQECFDSLDVDMLLETLRSHKTTQRIIEESYDLLYPDRTFRHALKELRVDPDFINETLLHLEGYCTQSVAKEIHTLVQSMQGAELGAAVLRILTPQSNEHVNERIPQDINWMDEMIYQIGLSYRRQFGESMVISCRSRGVDSAALEELTGRLYGLEISSSARELFTLIRCAKEGSAPPEGAEARICNYLETRGPKYRERVIAAYQSNWAHQAGFGGLLDDMTKFFKDSASKRKLLAMLLSVMCGTRSYTKPWRMLAKVGWLLGTLRVTSASLVWPSLLSASR